jgi:hypothetical protein
MELLVSEPLDTSPRQPWNQGEVAIHHQAAQPPQPGKQRWHYQTGLLPGDYGGQESLGQGYFCQQQGVTAIC